MFKIDTKGEEVNISNTELFHLILKQCFLNEDNPHLHNIDNYVEIITETLKKDLLKANLNQMFSVFFMAGYYYKVFLNNNNAIMEDTKEEK
ncbi:hypothetical protein CMI37_08810 [Candidatus Pacearchaeota archaeon]|nr:hypothetical protein [Candidatus Pacearchaeota archaeon]|tara:strand:- start:885 stop:1157 length:273 start_codon:yes stop_codon:yes gene_type:complete